MPAESPSADPPPLSSASESLTPDALRARRLEAPASPDRVVDALRNASRRGKLAGFRTLPGNPGSGEAERRCACDIFGAPYDRDLLITIEPTPAGGSTIRLDTRLRRKLPLAMAIVFALALWPGVWLTDSLLVTYFAWYPRNGWITTAWYIPMMLLAIPVLWKQYRRSESMAHQEAARVVAKIERFIASGA